MFKIRISSNLSHIITIAKLLMNKYLIRSLWIGSSDDTLRIYFQRDTSRPGNKKNTLEPTQRCFYKSIILSASEVNTKISIKVFFGGKTTNVNQQGAVANTCYVLSDNIYWNFNSLRGVKKMKQPSFYILKYVLSCNSFLTDKLGQLCRIRMS